MFHLKNDFLHCSIGIRSQREPYCTREIRNECFEEKTKKRLMFHNVLFFLNVNNILFVCTDEKNSFIFLLFYIRGSGLKSSIRVMIVCNFRLIYLVLLCQLPRFLNPSRGF